MLLDTALWAHQGPAQPQLESIQEVLRTAPPQPMREASSVQLVPPNSNVLATVNPFLQRYDTPLTQHVVATHVCRSSIDSLRTPQKRASLTDSLNAGSLSHRDSIDLLTRLSSGLHSGQSLSALIAAPMEGSGGPAKVHESEGSGTTTRWSMPPAATATASMMQSASSLLAGPLGSELLFPGKDGVPMLPGDSGLLSLASLGPLNSLKLGDGPLLQQLDPSLLQDLAPWALAGAAQQKPAESREQRASAAPEPPASKAENMDMQQLLQLAATLSQHPLP